MEFESSFIKERKSFSILLWTVCPTCFVCRRHVFEGWKPAGLLWNCGICSSLVRSRVDIWTLSHDALPSGCIFGSNHYSSRIGHAIVGRLLGWGCSPSSSAWKADVQIPRMRCSFQFFIGRLVAGITQVLPRTHACFAQALLYFFSRLGRERSDRRGDLSL